MKELADINNLFYTLLNRIDEIPNLEEKLTTELLKQFGLGILSIVLTLKSEI